MRSSDPDGPSRPLVEGRVLPLRTSAPAPTVAAHLAAAGRRVSRVLRGLRYDRPASTTARMLVLVPAHDADATIGGTLQGLLTQTRVPDRIVVLADDCTDRTEEIARRFGGVTVMRTVDNTHGTVGALNQGWRRWQAGHDQVVVVDADTVPAPDCLEQLAHELARTVRPGSVTASDADVLDLGATAPARLLLRLRRTAPAAEVRTARALTGPPALYSAAALRDVADAHRGRGPWMPAGRADESRLATDLNLLGYPTRVSTSARAHTGPRLTVHRLRTRRPEPTPARP